MIKATKSQSTCLACGSISLVKLIDLGVQPHANDFSETNHLKFREPLLLMGCKECGHAQQEVFVHPEMLFIDYHYASGTSKSLKNYFDKYARDLVLEISRDSRILEIACNDGSFMESLASQGFRELKGVDPASNIVSSARSKGLNVDDDFFNSDYANRHLSVNCPKYNFIVGQNVLAHTPDPLDLLKAAKLLLAPGGLIQIQTSQANMIFNGEFDTIYHEHYSFFSAHSMQRLAARAGLILVSLDYPDVHGTSFRFTLKSDGEPGISVTDRLNFEIQHGLLDGKCFKEFSKQAENRVNAYRQHIKDWHENGLTVVGVGMAAKSVTFFNYAGVFPDFVIDEAPLKVGKYLPGSNLRVQPLLEVASFPPNTVFVIGAWNFFDELKEKIKFVRGPELGHGDLFVRYLPVLEIKTC
jgi:2-polyprenyl-3-methyl-5-hydroxy-6-metoxy-1,4-benzoquinol methylase